MSSPLTAFFRVPFLLAILGGCDWTIRRDGTDLRQIIDPSHNPSSELVRKGPGEIYSSRKSLDGSDACHPPTWIRQDHAVPGMSA